jgi:hypothetical protein
MGEAVSDEPQEDDMQIEDEDEVQEVLHLTLQRYP